MYTLIVDYVVLSAAIYARSRYIWTIVPLALANARHHPKRTYLMDSDVIGIGGRKNVFHIRSPLRHEKSDV
jgi:hypothetical protein